MKTIHKYELKVTDMQVIQMPEHAKVLSANVQHGTVYIWAMVRTENKMVDRKVYMHGTGHTVLCGDKAQFVETVMLYDGNIVLHIFVE